MVGVVAHPRHRQRRHPRRARRARPGLPVGGEHPVRAAVRRRNVPGGAGESEADGGPAGEARHGVVVHEPPGGGGQLGAEDRCERRVAHQRAPKCCHRGGARREGGVTRHVLRVLQCKQGGHRRSGAVPTKDDP